MQTLLKAFSVGGVQHLLGSYSKRTLFPSDIDLHETLNLNSSPEEACLEIAKRLQHVLRALTALSSAPGVRVTDVKLGGTADEGLHWTAHQLLHAPVDEIAALIPGTKCKIDAAAWVPELARWIEVACLYSFTVHQPEGHGRRQPEPLNFLPSEETNTLAEDEAEFVREGDFWKALKRMASQGGKHEAALASYFDGPAGALAQLISDLRLLELLAETHQALPLATLKLELQGVEQRLPRINVAGLEESEAAVVHKLDKVIAALGSVRRRATVDKLGQTAEWVADRLDLSLQKEAKGIYAKFSKS